MKISLIIFTFSSSNLSQILKDQIKDCAAAYIHLHTHVYFLCLTIYCNREGMSMHSSAAVTGRWQCSVCRRARPGAIFFPQACDKAHKQYFSACINHLKVCNLNVSCINGFSQINENEAYSWYWKVQAQYVLYYFYYNLKTFEWL